MPVMHTPNYVEHAASPDQKPAKLSQNPQLSASERDRLEMYEEAWADLEMRGYKQASVIRFCPWDLTLDGAAHNCKRIPGVAVEAELWRSSQPRILLNNGLSVPYSHHVVSTPYITVGTRFRGRRQDDLSSETKAWIELPIVLAQDMVQQQNAYRSQGGIVCYDDAKLPQNADGQWLTTKEGALYAWLTKEQKKPLEQAIHEAFNLMVTHMHAIMDQATAAYISREKELMREIRGNRFRQCVQYLLNIGSIQEPPDWYLERTDGSKQKTVECPMCHKRVPTGVAKCACNYILDPFARLRPSLQRRGSRWNDDCPPHEPGATGNSRTLPAHQALAEHLQTLNKAAKDAEKGGKKKTDSKGGNKLANQEEENED